jgi:hypothetical protein
MSDDQPKVTNADAQTEMDIAANTQMTSDNLRKMGYEGAADTLHDAAHEAAMKAKRDGYTEPSHHQADLPPGWEQEGSNPPHPATTMGVPSGPGPGGPGERPDWPEPPEPVPFPDPFPDPEPPEII